MKSIKTVIMTFRYLSNKYYFYGTAILLGGGGGVWEGGGGGWIILRHLLGPSLHITV